MVKVKHKELVALVKSTEKTNALLKEVCARVEEEHEVLKRLSDDAKNDGAFRQGGDGKGTDGVQDGT